MVRACRLDHLFVCRSVGRSVCPESVLWQNGRLDPDAVWDGECGRSRDGCIDGVVIVEGEGQFWGEFRASLVTNGVFVA